MKVLVTINPNANPELHADMERTNPRYRAERMRTLATTAVVISSNGLHFKSAITDNQDNSIRNTTLQALKLSLDAAE